MYWVDRPRFEIPYGGKKYGKVSAVDKQGHFLRLIFENLVFFPTIFSLLCVTCYRSIPPENFIKLYGFLMFSGGCRNSAWDEMR